MFQGARRFYLAEGFDDLFLGTGPFMYDGGMNGGPPERLTGSYMEAFASFESPINSKYRSSIVTEWAFNGLGILDKVGSAFVLESPDADIALRPKGQSVQGGGVSPQHPETWLSTAVRETTQEFETGIWNSDDLLTCVLNNNDTFWWQGHTLSHLARDNLGAFDCAIEDGRGAQIAVHTGPFTNNNGNWRSMTSPANTGHYNKFCLQSGKDNLMTCYPGDNSYDLANNPPVSLVNEENKFHSIYTTESANGLAGMQIVPRFATFVYVNFVTGDCLVQENEWIGGNN